MKKILIADDEARVRLIVRDSLQRIGSDYEIVSAADGLEALRCIEQERFDLVITDVRMPGMNGVELTRAIGEVRPGTRVIWMTAYGCHETLKESLDLHVYRCLDKPIEISEIRSTVREALEGQGPRPRQIHLPNEDNARLALAGSAFAG